MTTHNDFLMGRIALERGLLSMDQLADCLNDQREAPAATLGNIMLRKGLIRPKDLDTLLDEQKRRLSEALEISDPRLEDTLLGRLLIRQGLVKEAQVYECLRAMAEMGERGEKAPRLGELLVRRGHLTTDAVDRALFLPRPETLICPSCGTHHSTIGTDASKKYACKQCGCVLDRHARAPGKGETTEAVRIDLPDDAAIVARDPVRRFAGGRYLLIQEAGRGGMGVVWKAWQTELRRYVAVKILAGTQWTDVELKRFYREAQMAASLSHPNIGSIFEVGAHDGKHFIVMEYVDGDSLGKLLAPSAHRAGTTRAVKHLPIRRAIEILREAAVAVDYAHTKKIIHRDLKPHNIMVQRADGRVYVMDFGLAKPLRQESISISDAIVGTPQYMSPEQARGDAVDPRTDVFSLGAVLYHALTGKPPFEGRSPAETMMAVLADDPTPPRKLNPRVHADVETICLKALDKDRDRRYDTARSLADDLGRYLDGEPISARPLSRRERTWRELRKRPLQLGLAAAGLGALLLIAGIFTVQAVRGRSRVAELLEAAETSIARGAHEEARGTLEQVLALDEGHALARERWEQAVEAIRRREAETKRLVADRAREIANYHRDAESFFKRQDYDEAFRISDRILALDATDAVARQRKAECEKQIEKRRDFFRSLEDKVAEFQEKDREREAEEKKRRQARLSAFPDYEQARRAMATGRRMRPDPGTGFTIADVRREFERADDALTKALEKDPTYAEAQYFRGQVRHSLGRFPDAVADFQSAWEGSSKSGPAAFEAAVAQLAVHMMHSTAPHYTDRTARDRAVAGMLAWAEQTTGPAHPAFERWCAKALIEFHARRFDKALEALQTVRTEGRAEFFYYFIAAAVHLESGDGRAALQSLKTALDLERTAPEALYLSAVVKARTGTDLTGAREDAEEAVQASPSAGEHVYLPHLLLADIYHQLNEPAKALSALDHALLHAGDRATLAGELRRVRGRWEQNK